MTALTLVEGPSEIAAPAPERPRKCRSHRALDMTPARAGLGEQTGVFGAAKTSDLVRLSTFCPNLARFGSSSVPLP